MASPAPTPLPSAALDAATWDAAHAELLAFLRDLIRIPSINPPDPPGPEMDAAVFIADRLRSEGLEPEVIESAPGRGNVTVRLRGDGTGGRRRAPAAEPPRCRPGAPRGRLDARSVRRRRRGRLRLGSRRRRHEADGRDGDARRGPARAPCPRRRPGPGPRCDPGAPPRRPVHLHRGRGGGRARGREVARRPPPRDPPRGGRAQRVWRRVAGARRSALLPDPGGREGLRGLQDPCPRHVGSRVDAPRGQRRRPRVRGRAPHGRPRRAAADPGHAPVPGRRARGAPAGPGGPRRGDRRRRPPAQRGRDPLAVRPDVRAGPRRPAARLDQPGRHPRRDQVQRHPRRGDGRDRRPHAPRHHAGRRARGGPGAPRATWRRTATWSTSSGARRSPPPPRASSTT